MRCWGGGGFFHYDLDKRGARCEIDKCGNKQFPILDVMMMLLSLIWLNDG